VLVGPPSFGFEGAYFTRAAGVPKYSSAFESWGSGLGLFDVENGNLWIGAGLACLLGALGTLLAHRAGVRLVHVRTNENAAG
jgi:hypothetical protein